MIANTVHLFINFKPYVLLTITIGSHSRELDETSNGERPVGVLSELSSCS